MAFALAADSPAARSFRWGIARMASGVGKPFGKRSRTRPRIVEAAFPVSCWYTIARVSAANGPSMLVGPVSAKGPTLAMCRPSTGSRRPSSASTCARSIGSTPSSGHRQGMVIGQSIIAPGSVLRAPSR